MAYSGSPGVGSAGSTDRACVDEMTSGSSRSEAGQGESKVPGMTIRCPVAVHSIAGMRYLSSGARRDGVLVDFVRGKGIAGCFARVVERGSRTMPNSATSAVRRGNTIRPLMIRPLCHMTRVVRGRRVPQVPSPLRPAGSVGQS